MRTTDYLKNLSTIICEVTGIDFETANAAMEENSYLIARAFNAGVPVDALARKLVLMRKVPD